jgi:hypothetical protein
MFADLVNGPIANKAMKEGRYAEAAKHYELSAGSAYDARESTSMRMCALLAVKAYSKVPDTTNAIRFALQTIEALKAIGLPPVDQKGFAKKALEELRQYDHHAAADDLSTRVGQIFGAEWHDPAAPRLPAFCPSCGAPVKPAEVVRPTPSTIACKFCGGSLG